MKFNNYIQPFNIKKRLSSGNNCLYLFIYQHHNNISKNLYFTFLGASQLSRMITCVKEIWEDLNRSSGLQVQPLPHYQLNLEAASNNI